MISFIIGCQFCEIYSPVVSREEWQNAIQNDEFVQQLLTSYELLVDSAEQPRERPKDYQEQKKFFSGKKHASYF